ncbi:MAG: hypothetical protein IPL36_13275 [Nigerium sp.]|nr:hypothetical protein [Nigerium sp.]
MTAVPMPVDSMAKVDLLLGQAIMLAPDHWDDTTATLHEAMGIALLMAAQHPTGEPVDLPDVNQQNVLGFVEQALREVQSWDLALAADLPDLARLRVLLADVRRALVAAARQG